MPDWVRSKVRRGFTAIRLLPEGVGSEEDFSRDEHVKSSISVGCKRKKKDPIIDGEEERFFR